MVPARYDADFATLEGLIARTGHARFRVLWLAHPDGRSAVYRVARQLRGEPEPEPRREPPLPSPLSMARNAVAAVARNAAAGFARADDATREARLATCRACPLYRPSDGRCGACGCWCAAKAALEQERCPDGRWPA